MKTAVMVAMVYPSTVEYRVVEKLTCFPLSLRCVAPLAQPLLKEILLTVLPYHHFYTSSV